jgi:hypothetical protein
MNLARNIVGACGSARRQQGTVLLITLVILAVLMISGVALVRSFDTSLFQAGNIAFKRDLVNQGERVVPAVSTAFEKGALATPSARANSMPAGNYSATILPSNAQGVPLALLDDSLFDRVASKENNISVPEQGVTISYVVDRQCSTAGLDTSLGEGDCIFAEAPSPPGGSDYMSVRAEDPAAGGGGQGATQPQVVYRISIRVDGPRNTQAFLQTTFTR